MRIQTSYAVIPWGPGKFTEKTCEKGNSVLGWHEGAFIGRRRRGKIPCRKEGTPIGVHSHSKDATEEKKCCQECRKTIRERKELFGSDDPELTDGRNTPGFGGIPKQGEGLRDACHVWKNNSLVESGKKEGVQGN